MSYVARTIIIEVVVSVALAAGLCLLSYHYAIALKLNYEAMIDAFVNLNAGIVIAIFLALFNSVNSNIDNFKKFIKATKQIYILFLVGCAVACATSLFVTNTETGKIVTLFWDQQSFNIIFSLVSIVFTFFNLRLVYKILRVAFKSDSDN